MSSSRPITAAWLAAIIMAIPLSAESPLKHPLALYADNLPDEATAQLLALQRSAAQTKDGNVPLRWRITARRWSAHQPEALIPIAGLFARVHAQLLLLDPDSAQSIQTAVNGFLRLYLARSTSPHAPATASRVLTHMALNVRDDLSAFAAVEVLDRALQLDPKNRVALHILAALAEKDGDYDRAGELLDRLLALDPGNAPAHLRRAVVTLHRGETELAIARLGQVLTQDVEPWMAMVAYQELARALLRAGQTALAEQTLEQGLARFPEQQQFVVLLAFLRRDRFAAAHGLLAGLTTQAWPGLANPRVRYDAWPDDEVNPLRQQLANEVKERLPALAEVLHHVSEDPPTAPLLAPELVQPGREQSLSPPPADHNSQPLRSAHLR